MLGGLRTINIVFSSGYMLLNFVFIYYLNEQGVNF